MSVQSNSPLNKTYFTAVIVLTFLLPTIGCLVEMIVVKDTPFTAALAGKWFIFSAVGLRLFAAGIKQITDPAFTAKQIFAIDSPESLPIVRELGFANLCFGLIGIVSLFIPEWRTVSAFGSGLYYGIAGVQHIVKKPEEPNERLALITDMIIFVILAAYFAKMI